MKQRFKEHIKQDKEEWGLPEEVESIEEMIRLYRAGKISDNEFRRFRLQYGAYGARLNQDFTMMRIKVPAGILFPDQLRRLASLSEAFSIGSVHVSTRQNIQMHWIYLDDVPEVERGLVEVGLTTRESCGNTIRNIVVSPFAGVCKKEPFDVTPYAKAFAKFFLRNTLNQNLPRKFKFNFACCEEHNLSKIADMGLVPITKEENGKIVRGFRVYLGGGLGPASFIAELLEEFTNEDQLLPTAIAVIRLFDRLGDRINMHRNRMRYLVHDMGFNKFKELVLKEREIVNATKSIYMKLDIKDIEKPTKGLISIKPFNASNEYKRWFNTNVVEQKQQGYYLVFISLQMGDISANQLRELARVVEEFSGENAIITTPQQGFVIRWVLGSDLPKLYKQLSSVGLAKPGALSITSAVACVGTTSCNLAITNSHRLDKEIQQRLLEKGLDKDKDLEGVTIHISGCPNSCGQHMIGTLGFYGGASRVNNTLTPTYNMLIGGRIGEDARLGRVITRVPAKRVIDVILKMISIYKSERNDKEKFTQWIDRILEGRGSNIKDVEELRKIIEEEAKIPDADIDADLYLDYGSDNKFTAKTARGECAA
ncbi:MAG: nitrite/sulfite reductase [Candidatus Nitrosocaldaceae archaeon]